MKKLLSVCIAAFACICIIAAFGLNDPSYAIHGKSVQITPGGDSVMLDEETGICYFEADTSGGYTFTVRTQDYVFLNESFGISEAPSYEDDDFFSSLGYTGGINVDYGDCTGKTVTHRFSIYAEAGNRYCLAIDMSYAMDYTSGDATVTLAKTDKAGIYQDLEFWSSEEGGTTAAFIMGYRGSDSTVTVPGEIHGMPVDTISDDAFSFNEELEELIINEGVRRFGNNVGSNCPNLKKVSLPSTFEEVANKPFQGCFLEEICFPKGNQYYSWENTCLILGTTNLVGYYGTAEEFHVPRGIGQVEAKAFLGTKVNKLWLPDSVKEISTQMYTIDELHVASSYCDISWGAWIGGDPENKGYGVIYGPHDSLTEKQAAQYDIPFIVEGTAQQYYEVKESSNSDPQRVYHHGTEIYRYGPDNYYYGEINPQKTGVYTLYWSTESGGASLEYVKDSSGNRLAIKKADKNYVSGRSFELKAGKHYTFRMRSSAMEDGEEYMQDCQLVYLVSPKDSGLIQTSAGTFKILSKSKKTASFTKAKNRSSITVPATVKSGGKTYKVTTIGAKAFTAKKIRTVTAGKNVKKITKYAFKSSNAKTLILKTKGLTKSSVKGSLKGSKVNAVKVKVGTKKLNKKYIKKYKPYFTKSNAGRKATVK